MFRKITMEIYGKPMGKYPRRNPNFENLRHHVLLEETFVLNSFYGRVTPKYFGKYQRKFMKNSEENTHGEAKILKSHKCKHHLRPLFDVGW